MATRESPNNAGAFAAAYEKKGTNTNAAACVAASRRDKTPRDAEASISRVESVVRALHRLAGFGPAVRLERGGRREREGAVERGEDAGEVEWAVRGAERGDDGPRRGRAARERRGGEDASLGGDGDAREGDAHPAELQGDAQAGEEEALAVDEEEEEGHGGGSSAVEEVAPGARGDVDGEEGAPRAEERRLGQLEDVEDVDDHEPDEEGAEDRAAAAPDEHRQRGDERQTRAEGVAPRAMDVQERRPRGRGRGRPRGGVVGVERAPGAPEILHRRRARGTTACVSTDAPPDVRWPDRGPARAIALETMTTTKSVRESAVGRRARERCCFLKCAEARGGATPTGTRAR